MNRPTFVILSSCLILLCAGCSGREEAPPEPAETNHSAAKIAGADTADVPAAEATDPAPARQPIPAAEPAPAAAATPVSDPTPVLAPVAKPGESIEVAATKAGLTRIGDAKCKMCHKIQHASWAKSGHAGLVQPEASFCKNCHADDWSDDLLAAAHEHKPAS
jgi:hypothetical protein